MNFKYSPGVKISIESHFHLPNKYFVHLDNWSSLGFHYFDKVIFEFCYLLSSWFFLLVHAKRFALLEVFLNFSCFKDFINLLGKSIVVPLFKAVQPLLFLSFYVYL